MMTFEEIRTNFAPLVRAAVGKMVPPTDRPDVEAEVWISIWTALRNFNGHSSVSTYIYPIVRRRIADYFRHAYHERRTMLAAQMKAAEDAQIETQEDPRVVTPTAAELRVLRKLAEGLKNDDIARELFLSKETVRSHIRHLYKKLKVKNRGELAIFAYRFFKEAT